MKNQALISVIIPCYNYSHFLEETVNSVLDQTYQNFECLIIDDGSQDSTREVAEELEKKDPRVKYFHQTNQGLSAARNTGILKSKGEFIQFLDADDLLSKEKLASQAAVFAASEKTDIVYCRALYFDTEHPAVFYKDFQKKGREWMPKVSGRGRKVLRQLIRGNIMVVSAPLVRRSLFDKTGFFDIELKSYEDWDLWMRAAENNFHFYYSDDANAITYIRLHGSSMTNNGVKMLTALVVLYKKHKVFFSSDSDLNGLFDRKFKKAFISLVAYYKTDKQELSRYVGKMPFTRTERSLLCSNRGLLNFILLKMIAKLK
nr:glycosyltransferase [Cesiribacter sp. SM1]